MQECKSPLLLMPPWLMQGFFSAGWGERERAVPQDFSDEHERGNFPQVFCEKRIWCATEECALRERDGVCRIWERPGAVTFGVVVEY